MALGASRRAILRQLLTESLVLGVAGGISGIGIGYFGLAILKAQLSAGFTFLERTALDLRVLIAMAGVSILASVFFGFFPALQAGCIDIRTAQTGRGVVGGSRSLSRRALSTFQIAMAVCLLIGAGLLLRSFQHLWNLEPGLDATNVITANFSLRNAQYETTEPVNHLFREVLARLRQVNGVENAAVALTLPFERGLNLVFKKPDDTANSNVRLTNLSYISPEFFDALRIPILRGRAITEADGLNTLPVIVVNEAFARAHFRGEDPIGAELRFGSAARQVVGVVGNVQQAGFGNFGPLGPVPAAYVPALKITRVDPAQTLRQE